MKLGLFLFFLLCIVNSSVPSKVILAIGGAGLGKSFTATLFGFKAVVGHTTNSTTEYVEIFQNNEYVFIDTPGFDGTNVEVEDKVTSINILSKMQEENITEVHTVFWFVHYDSKANQSLQKQVKLIETLAQSKMNKMNNIWNNVIVVYKGLEESFDRTVINDVVKKVDNSIDLAKTHLMAVKLYETLKPDSLYRNIAEKELHNYGILGIHEDIMSLLYRNIAEKELHKYGIYKKEKLLGIYKNIMQEKHHAENPVRIVFENDTCVKCGIKGDRRLVENFPCHTKEEQRHDKDENDNDLTEEYKLYTGGYRHTGKLITVQDWRNADDIDDIVRDIPVFKFFPGIGIVATQRQMWSCCRRNVGSKGCESISSSRRRHTCCHKDVGAPGCKKFCTSCDGAWGNSEGCSHREKHKYLD